MQSTRQTPMTTALRALNDIGDEITPIDALLNLDRLMSAMTQVHEERSASMPVDTLRQINALLLDCQRMLEQLYGERLRRLPLQERLRAVSTYQSIQQRVTALIHSIEDRLQQ